MDKHIKKALKLIGLAIVLFIVFVILHNLVSALFNAEEPVFFILALITGLIGIPASIIYLVVAIVKNRSS
ncbi:MAG: hypothetical protein QF362_04435 [Candidatus Woesearchaeota archaeon]|jgi:predicted Abi (CAAX) family protease|nr:hypothetical protein [Candidatus Woesearchaeota archaeon]MDP7506661.1 hypothetical protein [Candidatus Woesearchaeota archaeon]|tara:strand:- start:888 stop:1097 length:210 start_codon:yes stop_codon:yes gene_type:complete